MIENVDADILAKAKYWSTSPDFDAETHDAVQQLLNGNSPQPLIDAFYRDLEFGTGGLRGVLGPGPARMNIYNVRRACTAVAKYILKYSARDPALVPKVAISYDSRRFSQTFAHTCIEVLSYYGIHSVITGQLRPVPMLSFAVRKYSCTAGICVTASHNPPEYNGLKVYWREGSQIIPPHDQGIIAVYNKLGNYGELKWLAFEEAQRQGLVTVVSEDLDNDYFSHVESLILNRHDRSPISIVFTPLHGTSHYPVTECLRRYGFDNVTTVKEQQEPDAMFPTVSAPNPEDPQAMQMAVDLAKERAADLVLATDPDGDRIGMVVREDSEYVRFSGNQMICLLTEYVLSSRLRAGAISANDFVVKTIVTTELMRSIVESYKVRCEETLTGFKWICDLVNREEQKPAVARGRFICGGEESYGFLAGDFVRDKDAMISCCIAAEMLAFYRKQGRTLSQVLDELFCRYGVYVDELYTLTLPGQAGAARIVALMEQLRVNPPRAIDGIDVVILRDFAKSQELRYEKNGFQPSSSLRLPVSNVLQLILADGTIISARPSGTEPKIKFYLSVKEEVETQMDLPRHKATALKKMHAIKSKIIELANTTH